MDDIDRKEFFAKAKPLFGHYLGSQVDGVNKILDEWEKRQLSDRRWLGYMLATTYHETARAMQPIREEGGETYLRSKPYWPWVGEGLVQVTWEYNAKKFGATAPGQLMTWPRCLSPLFDGMIDGMFTGKKLADYIVGKKCDFVNARRIINGLDRAHEIAGYAEIFNRALVAQAEDGNE